MNTQQVYYVDENDNPTGESEEKMAAHTSQTRLHAAFSCYIFNEEGKFLVTKRAAGKKVWPNFWTNSVCGHPAPKEKREDAIIRRAQEELGLTVRDIQVVLPEYTYKTPPYNGIIENEFCPVYVAIATSEVNPNNDEVSDYQWVDWSWYEAQLRDDPQDYTVFAEDAPDDLRDAPTWSWWCKDQLSYLQTSRLFLEYLKVGGVKFE